MIVSPATGGVAQTADLLIGRGDDCDIRLSDHSVSRKHALIEPSTDGYFVSDQHSTNGTFVNDKQLDSPWLLQDGDYLRVGMARSVLAQIKASCGDPTGAAEAIDPVLRLVDGAPDEVFVPGLDHAMGLFSMRRDDWPAAVSWLLGIRCHFPTMNVLYPRWSSISDRKPFSNGTRPL